jgi:hypothetical protein
MSVRAEIPIARLASVPELRRSWVFLVITMLLGLLLQWVTAHVYAGLVVELFGGVLAEHTSAGAEVALSYVITALATAACALYCVSRSGASRVIAVIHLVGVIIPMQALVAANFEMARPEFAVAVALAYLGTLACAHFVPDVRLPTGSVRASAMFLVAAVLASTYVFWTLVRSGGLERISFDLTKVYDVREEYVERLAPFVGYLVPWQGYVLNPALLLVGFRRRSLLTILTGITLEVLLFGMTGYRAFLFIPPLLLVFYIIGPRRNLLAIALGGILATIGLALVLYAWLDLPLIPQLLVDRVVIVQAEIHYWYYDYFGVHAHAPLQLSQSLLAAIAPGGHYRTPVAEVIGWQYMGSADSPNVGVFGDAFANFGFAGCAVYALLFGMLLKAVDAAGRFTDVRVASALLAMPAFELINVGLLTTLLTQGLGLTIVVLWVLGRSPSAPATEDRR